MVKDREGRAPEGGRRLGGAGEVLGWAGCGGPGGERRPGRDGKGLAGARKRDTLAEPDRIQCPPWLFSSGNPVSAALPPTLAGRSWLGVSARDVRVVSAR